MNENWLLVPAIASPLYLCYWLYWEIKHAIREAKEDLKGKELNDIDSTVPEL